MVFGNISVLNAAAQYIYYNKIKIQELKDYLTSILIVIDCECELSWIIGYLWTPLEAANGPRKCIGDVIVIDIHSVNLVCVSVTLIEICWQLATQ